MPAREPLGRASSAAVVVCLMACAQTPTDAVPSSSPTATTAREVVVTIATKDARLRIYTDSSFAVVDHAGQVLALSLSEDELRTQFPDLHQAYREGVASGRVQDASLHVPRGEPSPPR